MADIVSSIGFNWSYHDEESWPGRKCQQGTKQSPIDIITNNVITDDQKFVKYGSLQFIGYDNVLMTAVNTGSTLQFSTEGDLAMHPMLKGGPLKDFYRLKQVHFHWASEHAINGLKYPIEVHFVHVREDLRVDQALKTKGGLSIVAVFCIVKEALTETEEYQIQEVMEVVEKILETGKRSSGEILNLNRLLKATESYVTYSGSLTTPECNEVVTWIIMDKLIAMTFDQYHMFSQIASDNCRSLQPLRTHVVYRPVPAAVPLWPAISKPRVSYAISTVFNKIGVLFQDASRFVYDVISKFRK